MKRTGTDVKSHSAGDKSRAPGLDNGGRVRISVILLGAVISFMIIVWVIILIGHFIVGRTSGDEIPPPGVEAAQDIIIGDEAEHEEPSPEPAPESTPAAAPVDAGKIRISAAFPDICRELDAIAEQYNSASVSLAVYDPDSDVYYTYEYGYADIGTKKAVNTDTKFFTASLTKLVTAICVMTLVDEQLIGLDADLSTYFGYDFRNPHFPDKPITARMLMQHMSSLFDSGTYQQSRDRGSSESVKYLIDSGAPFRRNEPGTRFEYSNFGYAVLGSLCERVSGKPLDTYAREVIFEPLGIDAAYVPSMLGDTDNIAVIYDSNHNVTRSLQSQLDITQSNTPGNDLHLAHANLTISASDYAKILAMLVNGGTLGNVTVLSSASVNEINRANTEGSGYMQGLATRYSEEGFITDDGFYWHTGSSFGIFSQYIYDLRQGRSAVAITSGATVSRLESSLFNNCTDMITAAWGIFDNDDNDPPPE